MNEVEMGKMLASVVASEPTGTGANWALGFAGVMVLVLIVTLIGIVLSFWILILIIKALRKYLKSSDIRKEKSTIKKSLGEALKENRLRCQMTQEFVAERLGVSRQAVSKWENGTSDPSTSNLLALAKLYGISAEELLKSVGEPESKE